MTIAPPRLAIAFRPHGRVLRRLRTCRLLLRRLHGGLCRGLSSRFGFSLLLLLLFAGQALPLCLLRRQAFTFCLFA